MGYLWRVVVIASGVMLAGCGGGGGGGGGGCGTLNGSYQGTTNDNVFGTGVFAASVVQNGCSVTGSAELCSQSLGCNPSDVTGTVSGDSFSLTLFNGGSCTDVVQGSMRAAPFQAPMPGRGATLEEAVTSQLWRSRQALQEGKRAPRTTMLPSERL